MASKGTEDWDATIRRAQQLDPEAFDAIVDAYSARLYGFLRRLTNAQVDVEDLTQEVFVRVVRTIADYEHDGRFEAWLFRIARNLVRDAFRRRKRAPGFASLEAGWDEEAGTIDEPVDAIGMTPVSGVETADDGDRLQVALARLPIAEREVILMRHYGQMSFQEIATAMDTPLGTALARAHRGLAKLREWMGPTS